MAQKLKVGDLALDSIDVWGPERQWVCQVTQVVKGGKTVKAKTVCWGPAKNWKPYPNGDVYEYQVSELTKIENPGLLGLVISLS